MAERPNTREDFTYLEIYRPVIGGVSDFLDEVSLVGNEVFGQKFGGLRTEPKVEISEAGVEEVVHNVKSIESPRLSVYPEGTMRMDLLDRRVPPQMNYASSFRYQASRLIKKPGDTVYRPIERSEEEKKRRLEQSKRESLAFRFEQIGSRYGIYDNEHLEVPLKGFDISVDPMLEHTGLELRLLPDPEAAVTRMLIEQAGVCLRSLGLKSAKAAFPYAPTSLGIPFARLPEDSALREESIFLQEVNELFPLRVILGGFKDVVGGASWQPKR